MFTWFADRLRQAALGMWRTFVTLRDHLLLRFAVITMPVVVIVPSVTMRMYAHPAMCLAILALRIH